MTRLWLAVVFTAAAINCDLITVVVVADVTSTSGSIEPSAEDAVGILWCLLLCTCCSATATLALDTIIAELLNLV